jgi:hypothetical protein
MNNKEVAHSWAHQTQSRASGSSFYYVGETIYSYGSHFPIARLFTHPKTKGRAVLFTTHGYSVTTSKHKGYARAAVSHLPVFLVDDVMGQKTDARSVAKLEKAEATRAASESAKESMRLIRREAKAAKLLAQSPEIVAEWLAGTRRDLPGQLNLPVMLRSMGETMETSKGARVPMEDARRTYRFAMAARAKGWHKNGETHAIGSYQLDAVNEAGVVAGCHRVTWSEIERFATTQGWQK